MGDFNASLFLFGNVDEQGRLENNFLGQETGDLLTAGTAQAEVGLDILADNGLPSSEPLDTIPKAPNAVDFSNIDEYAEEHITLGKSSGKAASSSEYDEYDEFDQEEEPAKPVAQKKSIPEPKKPQGNFILNAMQSFFPSSSSSAAPSSMPIPQSAVAGKAPVFVSPLPMPSSMDDSDEDHSGSDQEGSEKDDEEKQEEEDEDTKEKKEYEKMHKEEVDKRALEVVEDSSSEDEQYKGKSFRPISKLLAQKNDVEEQIVSIKVLSVIRSHRRKQAPSSVRQTNTFRIAKDESDVMTSISGHAPPASSISQSTFMDSHTLPNATAVAPKYVPAILKPHAFDIKPEAEKEDKQPEQEEPLASGNGIGDLSISAVEEISWSAALKSSAAAAAPAKDSHLNVSLSNGSWVSAIRWDDSQPDSALLQPLSIMPAPPKQFVEVVEDIPQIAAPVVTVAPVPHRRRTRNRHESTLLSFSALMDDGRFNLSIDEAYVDPAAAARHQKAASGRSMVQHSLPAYRLSDTFYFPTPSPDVAEHFHRPDPRVPQLYRPYPIIHTASQQHLDPSVISSSSSASAGGSSSQPQSKAVISRSIASIDSSSGKSIDSKAQLTMVDNSRLVLVEHIEEHPPLVNNVGMGLHFNTFYQKRSDSEADIPLAEDGSTVLVENDSELPLMARVPTGSSVTAIETSMYRAAVARHTPKTTDFILIKRGNQFFIREVPVVYTAGHTQPQMEVNAPGSRPEAAYLRARAYVYLCRLFKKRIKYGQKPVIPMADFESTFQSIMTEASIRKAAREIADFRKEGLGYWVCNHPDQLPGEEELREKATPEQHCGHESAFAAETALQAVNINQFSILAAYAHACSEQAQTAEMKETINDIDRLRTRASFSRSRNLLGALEGKEPVQMPLLEFCQQLLPAEDHRMLVRMGRSDRAAARDKSKKGGTAAVQERVAAYVSRIPDSIPKPTTEEAKEILEKSGIMTEAQVKRISRAMRIDYARIYMHEKDLRKKGIVKEPLSDRIFAFAKLPSQSRHHYKTRELISKAFCLEAERITKRRPYYSLGDDEGLMEDDELVDELMKEFDDDDDVAQSSSGRARAKDLMSAYSSKNKKKVTSRRGGNNDDEEDDDGEREKLADFMSEFRGDMSDDEDDAPSAAAASASSSSSSKSGAGAGGVKIGKNTIARIRRKVTDRNGRVTEHVEIVRDPELVREYARNQNEQKLTRQFIAEGGNARNIGLFNSKGDRRLVAQFRRLAADSATAMKTPGSLPFKSSRQRESGRRMVECRACGGIGHTASNTAICPLANQPSTLPGMIRTEGGGMKLKFAKTALDQSKQEMDSMRRSGGGGRGGRGGASAGGGRGRRAKDEDEMDDEEFEAMLNEGEEEPEEPEAESSAEEDEDFDAAASAASSAPSRGSRSSASGPAKRRKTSASELADILAEILDVLKSQDFAYAFLQPVDSRDFPTYRRIISKPIDLSTIGKKIKNLTYLTPTELLEDLDLMFNNSYTFCNQPGSDPEWASIPQGAMKLKFIASKMLEERKDRINEILQDLSPYANA